MSEQLRYRDLYVVTPRAVTAKYARLSWADVLAAAERGEDGLAIHHGRPLWWAGPQQSALAAVPNVAYLTNGQGGEWEDKTVLHQQNW